jgi:tetratricopeptide (TPR) repeat protein
MAKKPQQKPKQPQAKEATTVVNKQPSAAIMPNIKAPDDRWLVMILIAVALLANIATLRYDYTLDDPYFTKDNPLVREGVRSIPEFFQHAAYYGVFKNHDASYRPLMLISFAVEKTLFDFNPVVSHVINLIIFALQIFCLYKLLRRLFHNYSAFIPFFILLLFELHPIHTEVIASVKSRDELLALLFTAVSMLYSFKYIDTDKMVSLILSAVFFFLALLSKESSITFVAIMLLTVYFFRDVKMAKIIKAVAPYVIMAGVYMLMRAAFIESDGEKVRIMVNNNALMAATNYGEKLATALFIQFKYLILLVIPHPLSYDYSYNQIPIISFANPKAIISVLVILGLLGYALVNLKRKDVFSYSILFYFAGAAITANILVDIGATMAERFVYTASLGYCIALVFLVVKLLKSDKVNLSYATAPRVFMVFVGISALYAVKTLAQNEVWKNNLVLYKSGIETAPNSWRAHYLLGVELTRQLNTEKDPNTKKELMLSAVEHFNASNAILLTTDNWLMKGYAFEFGGRDDSAVNSYRTTLTLDSTSRMAANNMGSLLLRHGDLNGAIQVLRPLVNRDTTFNDALCNLAAAYGNSGNFKESEKYYLMAVRKNPNQQPNVFMSMSNIYKFMGDSANAQHYRVLMYNALKGGK